MLDLDSLGEISKLDKGKILESIHSLPEQFSQAWDEVNAAELPKTCSAAQNVVICGMGGSGLGGRIVDSLVFDRARVPIEVFNEYKIPNYVNTNTFVILYSYSGGTEETLSAARLAKDAGAKIFGITTGGKLAEFLKENNLSGYVFEAKHNPSGQPRMGLGYATATTLALLSRCAFIRFADESELIINTLKKYVEEYNVRVPQDENLAKTIAQKLHNKIPIIFASEHLVGIAHAFANQLNENSKTFSALFDLPEANHHLMEGLKFPANARELLTFLFVESKNYTPGVLKRYPITKEVLEKNGYPHATYTTTSEDKLEEIFEVLVLGSYVSFYLAMLNGVDPTPIPWVDYFKERLSK